MTGGPVTSCRSACWTASSPICNGTGGARSSRPSTWHGPAKPSSPAAIDFADSPLRETRDNRSNAGPTVIMGGKTMRHFAIAATPAGHSCRPPPGRRNTLPLPVVGPGGQPELHTQQGWTESLKEMTDGKVMVELLPVGIHRRPQGDAGSHRRRHARRPHHRHLLFCRQGSGVRPDRQPGRRLVGLRSRCSTS